MPVTSPVRPALLLLVAAAVVPACGDGESTPDETTAASSESSGTANPTDTSGVDPSTSSSGADTTDATTGVPTPPVTEGEFTLLSYNVAGLPDGVSGSMPVEYTPLISPLLNLYDLALVQEDFAYHVELSADAEHPYQSTPHPEWDPEALAFGDGLNEFSQFPFDEPDRVTWAECNGTLDSGSDCLTIKGFFAATHTLSEGIVVDVYNLHMDAGGSPGDVAARDAQVAQLLAHIEAGAGDRPVIVAGDTNMDEEDEPSLQALIDGAGLVDVCRALACGEEYRIDRVLVRSSANIELVPVAWAIDGAFVDDEGNDLSDHEAVGVTIGWRWIGG